MLNYFLQHFYYLVVLLINNFMVQKTIRRTRIGNTLETTQPETISPPKTPPQPKFRWWLRGCDENKINVIQLLIFGSACIIAALVGQKDVVDSKLLMIGVSLLLLIISFLDKQDPDSNFPVFVGFFLIVLGIAVGLAQEGSLIGASPFGTGGDIFRIMGLALPGVFMVLIRYLIFFKF